MKFFPIIFILLTNYIILNAQNNIGIGTQTPQASALLDISSTSKGLLAPRMTTTQRNAVASPAKGLLVYDTDLNALYHYNGSAWAAVGGGGGGFSLPFEANVNLNGPTFQIQNSGSGDVLFLGASTGSAINAYNTGSSAAINVNAINGFGVYAQSFNSIPLYALSNNANNTLPAMRANNTGGGVGVHATSSNNDGIFGISSAANKAGVRGEGNGSGGIGIYGSATSNTGVGVSGFNSAGTGISGSSTSGYGVRGVTSSGIGFSGVYGENIGTTGSGVRGVANFAIGVGVSGSSTTGIGVGGYSESNRAVQAQTNSGTALFGNSTTGYALETSGKVKISGGNTNPSAGAVLTSVDANGNAVWKPGGVAFRATGAYSTFRFIPEDAESFIHFSGESYDYSNSFQPTTSNSPSANMSTFIAPVSGVYNFNLSVELTMNGLLDDFNHIILKMKINRGGNLFDGIRHTSPCCGEMGKIYTITANTDVRLLAGDRVFVQVLHFNDFDEPANIDNTGTFFTGRLVLAD